MLTELSRRSTWTELDGAAVPGFGAMLTGSYCSSWYRSSQNSYPDRVLVFDVMIIGTVDFFNTTSGYGFIDSDDSDADILFHMEEIGGPDLEEGEEIECDIVQSKKGPRAKSLTRQ